MTLKELLERLKKGETLSSCDLKVEHISAEGAIALAEALTVNSTLASLRLDYNDIGRNGASAIAQALTVNTTLASLNLYSNYIGKDGASAIAQALTVNTTLTSLKLGGNDIGKDGATAIAQALNVNTTLTSLKLLGNSINNRAPEEKIARYLRRNKALRKARRALKAFADFAKAPQTQQEITSIETYVQSILYAVDTLKTYDTENCYWPKVEVASAKRYLGMILLQFRNLSAAKEVYKELSPAAQRAPSLLALFAEYHFTMVQTDKPWDTILSCLVTEKQGNFALYKPGFHAMKVKSALRHLFLKQAAKPGDSFLSIKQALQQKGDFPQTKLTEQEAKLNPEDLAQQQLLALAKGYLVDPKTLLLLGSPIHIQQQAKDLFLGETQQDNMTTIQRALTGKPFHQRLSFSRKRNTEIHARQMQSVQHIAAPFHRISALLAPQTNDDESSTSFTYCLASALLGEYALNDKDAKAIVQKARHCLAEHLQAPSETNQHASEAPLNNQPVPK